MKIFTYLTKITKLIICILSLSLMITSCDNDNKSKANSSKKQQDKDNIIKIGISADNPPFEFLQNNEIQGFDIDLINEIGKHLNKKVILKNMNFNGLIAALSTDKIDAAISGISITEARKKAVQFSDVYLSTKIALLYRKEEKINAIEDIKNKIIGAQIGSTWLNIAKNISLSTPIKIKELQNNLALLEELKNKRIDGLILEQSQARKIAENNAQMLDYIVLSEYQSNFAIAFPNKSKIVNDVNKIIKTLKDNGEINNLAKKWLIYH